MTLRTFFRSTAGQDCQNTINDWQSTEGGVRVCGIAVLGYFWCGVAVILISKYGITVFIVQAVCGEFKFYVAVVGEKNRCVSMINFFFMTRGYKS